MNDTDVQLKLLAGLPIEIDGLGQLRQLTAKTVVSMNESYYNQLLSTLLFDKSNIEQLDEDQERSNFEILVAICYHDQDFRKVFLDALELFFGEKAGFFANEEYAFFYLGEIKEQRYIVAETLETIQKLLRKMNNLPEKKEEEDYTPGNEKARKFMEQLKKRRAKRPPKKETMNLHSIISGLAWKQNGMNIVDIWNLTLYQIYDGYFRTENIDNYSNVVRGIYAGTINGKDIDLSKINWANIIKIN